MEDQERVEELSQDFNQEKRPSQSSEDNSEWTFLEGRKSAESSPKPPKITINSNLLTPPEHHDAELSDGISVISEGDTHNYTPPESDNTAATTPDAKETRPRKEKDAGKFSFDSVRMTRSAGPGYRPMTPTKNQQTEDGDDEDDDEFACEEQQKLDVVEPKKKAKKLDLEALDESSASTGSRFGIYPRHIVFLMVVCGIIGGMIGHLWNVNYNGNCDAETQQLSELYSKAMAEKWILEERLANIREREPPVAKEWGQQHQRPTPKYQKPEKKRWSGHEEEDSGVTVEDEEEPSVVVPPEERTPIPSDEFGQIISDSLQEAEKSNSGDFGAEAKQMNAEKRYQKRSVPEADGEERKDTGHWKQKSHHSGEKYQQKYQHSHDKNGYRAKDGGVSKEAKYKEKHHNNGKYHEKRREWGSEEGRKRDWDKSDEDDDSREFGGKGRGKKWDEKRKSGDKYERRDKDRHSSGSGEWTDKRNKGRDELRQQRDGSGGKAEKNWYLERANEREIHRVETSSSA